MKNLVVGILLLIVFSSCSKDTAKVSFDIPDSTFSIKNTVQSDLNGFDFECYLKNGNDNISTDFGLAVQNTADASDKRLILIGTSTRALIHKNVTVDSLRGDAEYLVKLYAARQKDTIYGVSQVVRTQNLKIIDRGVPLFAYRPAQNTGFETNLFESNHGLHSRAWIGEQEIEVTGENGSVVIMNIPDDIPSGYFPLKISRKGLEAIYDSVYFFFGKLTGLPDYPVEPSPLTDLPNYITGFGVFQLGKKGFLFGGTLLHAIPENGGASIYNVPDYYLEYEYPANSWKRVYYSTPTRFLLPDVHVVAGKAYVVNGYIDTTRTSSTNIPLPNVYEFDPAGKKWMQRAQVPWDLRGKGVSFVANGRVYVGLGEGGDWTTGTKSHLDMWQYQPETDQWARLADFPGRPRINASTFVIQDKAYMIGGNIMVNNSVASPTNELWEYDTSQDSWKELHPKNPTIPILSPVCIVDNNKAYLLGGWELSASALYYAPNYEFDPVTQDFRRIVVPMGNASGGVIYQEGNKYVLVGGTLDGDHSQASRHVLLFRPE